MSELASLQLLRALDEGVAARTGAEFFPHLVSALARTLNASCAFASEFTHESYEANVLAFWCDGAFSDPFVYPLAGSPCECVLDNSVVTFPRNIAEMFPAERDALLQLGAQSYLAIPLARENGKVWGHLAVIDRRERDWNEADVEIIRIFSTRAAAELDRRDYERRLEGTNAALQKANAQLRREVTQRLDAEEQLATTAARNEHVAELVRVISSGVTAKTGSAFFSELVRSLCTALRAHTVFVSQIDTAKYQVEQLALWSGGDFRTPGSFNLANTPCESILDGNIASFPRNVAELFPAARPYLESVGIKSYLAIPMVDEGDQVVGHIAVQDQRERDWNEMDFDILRLFASRAAAELKRRAHENVLESTNTQFQKANAQLRREVAKRLEMEGELARAKSLAEHAQQAAEAANQAKSNFLAHMSHELRTPLNGILGYAQLLKRDTSLGSQHRESAAVIERSGEHLLMLINDLLDLAKIEAGRLDLHASLFDLPMLLKHVADLALVRAGQAGLAFRFEAATNLPIQVRGDERALRQILLNLLGNAVKFTQRGSIGFRVSTTSDCDERKCRVRFEVVDSGAGIAPEHLQQVFEPFARGSVDHRVEGTGLGLPITKRLVDAMGGKLEVTSAVGAGSTFSVELDFERADEAAANLEAYRRIVDYEGPRRRVLVVDNDGANRRLLARLLGDVRLEVTQAHDGNEALRLARAEPPDLIVTDLAMPLMDGVELARAVRASDGLRKTPMLAVSASVSAFTREEAIGAGCDDFLAKPIRTDELLEHVGRLLDLAWKHEEAESPAAATERPLLAVEGLQVDGPLTTELYDLAMKGDVQELVSRADAAVKHDPSGAPVYEEVRRLARRFDMKGVRRVLQNLGGGSRK
jgi:signal transduction histidine kinase/FixJ family two-component response regulator